MYSFYKEVPAENFAEVLLRTGKLAEAKTEGKTPFPATEGKHVAYIDIDFLVHQQKLLSPTRASDLFLVFRVADF